jgi:hypothetical protein
MIMVLLYLLWLESTGLVKILTHGVMCHHMWKERYPLSFLAWESGWIMKPCKGWEGLEVSVERDWNQQLDVLSYRCLQIHKMLRDKVWV